MKEEQFDPLEQRMRQAAQWYDPPHDEDAWKKMEAMLDAQDKRRRRTFAWWWIPDLAVVLLLSVFMLTIRSSGPGNDANILPAAGPEIKKRSGGQKEPDTQHSAADNEAAVLEGEVAGTAQPPVLVNSENAGGKIVKAPGFSSRTGPNGNAPVSMPVASLASSSGRLLSNGLPVRGDVLMDTAGTIELLPGDQGLPMETETDKATAETQSPDFSTMAGPAETGTEATAAALTPANASTVRLKKESHWTSHIGISAVAGTEWSWVKGRQPGKAGFLYGIGLGYTLNNRWAIQTGILQTEKLYTAGPEAYKVKPGSYYAYNRINAVDAECRVLEIPLLVRYNIRRSKPGTFYATAGFATAIMKEEEYYFDYKRANGQQAYATRVYATGNVHWFSSAMLSAGYEKPVGKRMSLSAQSFLKLPLAGVGEGNVRFSSFGVQAGINYSPFQ
jgi:hypothetical protein